MGDAGEDFKVIKERNKERKKANLKRANPNGWNIHTKYHWSRTLNGKRLDYWPSKNKWQYEGWVTSGDVDSFIRKRAGIILRDKGE